MKEWFKARNVWGAALQSMTDQEAGRFAKALWAFTMTGEKSQLAGAENALFAMACMTLETDEIIANDISAKRAVAGAIGGRQRQANASNVKQTEANEANACNKNKNKNKNIEKEKDNKSIKEPQKRFTPPTVEEVAAYCKERNNGIDAEYFVDYQTARNWVLSNGKQCKDWRATIRTWEKNSYKTVKKAAKTVPAQQYSQRDYSTVQDALQAAQDAEIEAYLKGVV